MEIPNKFQCLECSTSKECNKCASPFFLSNGVCCEQGSYYDGGECATCYENCLTCFGTGEKECLGCKRGFSY